MSSKKIGQQTIVLSSPPSFHSYANVAGKKEGEGPLSGSFDYIDSDDTFGQPSWEKAESSMQKQALTQALQKGNLEASGLDWLFAGDLLNQCVSSSFAARDQEIPFFGLYGACSTIGEGLALASMTLDGGFGQYAGVVASSHFCSAERQYRYPLEYGGQRSPAAQWTVTGAGCAVISEHKKGLPYIDKVIIGSVRDLGITDVNNMGAAMAPAAAQTIAQFLKDTHTIPSDYDLILTGDLGSTGSQLLLELVSQEYRLDISSVHNDCGMMIYDLKAQDMHSGGSGCGCSASVVCSYILDRIKSRDLKNVLFVGTGALLSPTSSMQKESIPGIAHGVLLKAE